MKWLKAKGYIKPFAILFAILIIQTSSSLTPKIIGQKNHEQGMDSFAWALERGNYEVLNKISPFIFTARKNHSELADHNCRKVDYIYTGEDSYGDVFYKLKFVSSGCTLPNDLTAMHTLTFDNSWIINLRKNENKNWYIVGIKPYLLYD